MVSTFKTRPTAEEKAADLRQRAQDSSRLEEKLIFLRSAVQYAPSDGSLLESLAEHLYDRGKELLALGDVNSALPYFDEAEGCLTQRNLLRAQTAQSVQRYGVLSEPYLRVLLAKMEGHAEQYRARLHREGRTCSYKAFLKRMKRYIPQLDVHTAPEPQEQSMLRERCYDWLLSLCKSLATTERDSVDPQISEGLYSLLLHSGYLDQLYEKDEAAFVKANMGIDRSRSLEGFKVRIFGAGVTGLTLAYCLRLRGAEIVGLLDRRGASHQQSRHDLVARSQNVSWTDLERYMRPTLGDELFEDLLRKMYDGGAVMDRREGKVRSSIGAYQEVVLKELEKLGVPVAMGYRGGMADLQTDRGLDMQCVCSGVRATRDFQSELRFHFFDDYACQIATHLTMYPAQEEYRFYSNDRDEGAEGLGWRSINETVQPTEQLEAEIQRYAENLRRMKTPQATVDKVLALQNEPMVAHRFTFGNDSPGFDRGLEHSPYPSLMSQVKIRPWILTRTISRVNPDVPTVFMGDATCSTHPLAAIGHSLVFQNVSSFMQMAECKQALKRLASANDNEHVQRLISKLDLDCEELYERRSRQAALMVFLQSCLSGMYSVS